MSVVLLTNNPLLKSYLPDAPWLAFVEAGLQVTQAVTAGYQAAQKLICVFFETDAKPVVAAGRDCIHIGWKLSHHPLYGNYRPHQQPYRSLALTSPAPESSGPDLFSLHLIEEALLVYTNNNALAPAEAPASLLDACALLDYELMRLPLEQSGVISREDTPCAAPGQGKHCP